MRRSKPQNELCKKLQGNSVWPVSFVAAVFVFISLTREVHAAIIWDYQSTNGTTTLGGTMTTTGNFSDLAAAGSFSTVSIDTVVLNGTDITAAANWFNGESPPFSSSPLGAIAWDTVLGVVDTSAGDFVFALSTPINNRVELTWPGSGQSSLALSNAAGFIITQFTPSSTTFSPIPEPSTFVLAALGLLGLAFYGWRRRRRA